MSPKVWPASVCFSLRHPRHIHGRQRAICHRPRIDLGQGLHDLTAGDLASKGIKLTKPIWIWRLQVIPSHVWIVNLLTSKLEPHPLQESNQVNKKMHLSLPHLKWKMWKSHLNQEISVKVPPCCPHQSHSSQPLPPCPWNPPGARASRGSVPEATHIRMPKSLWDPG